ncbi:unnamed protein product [Blepharisma stoltei]|uniref:Uncharacterized protein n=1 Tax=Blepharisma stoltei TaxID=1481888 RepID=A0AAU9JI33_9CILI|nr:unnamed protein product [Blepharisma stoltei]
MCIEEDTNEVKGEDPGITLLKRNIKALQAENLQIKEEISSVKTLVENGQKEMRESFEKLSLAISARCNDKQ